VGPNWDTDRGGVYTDGAWTRSSTVSIGTSGLSLRRTGRTRSHRDCHRRQRSSWKPPSWTRPDGTANVLEVLGEGDSEHYRVRWQDGRESIYFPGPDAQVTSSN